MKVILLLCFLLFMGCSTMQGIDEHVDVNPANHSTIYRDQYVRKSSLEVYIQPTVQSGFSPKALFVPFRVTQEMSKPTMFGYSTARSIWQTWAGMQLFRSMEFSGDDTPFRRDRAVLLAKQRGADIVIGGFVTYIYAGGTAGDTQIALQLEVIDANSGQTIWSMAQSALLPAAKKRDYFMFAVQERLPSDPLLACIRDIAMDMGEAIHSWTQGKSQQKQQQLDSVDTSLHDAMYPRSKGLSSPSPLPRNAQGEGGL